MKVLACGSRDWTDSDIITALIVGLPGRPVVVHGGARGADSIAGSVAERLGLKTEVFPADWRGHGRAAGPIRNRLMLAEGKPDVVVAFKDEFDWTLTSGGTENMVRLANEAGVRTYVVSHG